MAILKRSQTAIYGLTTDLQDIRTSIGDLSTLTTTEKQSIVVALNEIAALASATPDDVLVAGQNLADVDNVETARTNLDVYSREEVTQAIDTAQMALGTTYTVTDIAARDGLENVNTADRVFVENDGDGKWAIYRPSSMDTETGAVATWQKLGDQDVLENALTAQGIKQAYESNDDTNAFTDAEKTKLAQLSGSGNVDLDRVLTRDDVVPAIGETPSEDTLPSTQAVVDYISQQMSRTALENVVVEGDRITLAFQPSNGTASVLNFATVRYLDTDNVAYDAPIASTETPGIFTVLVDEAGQWNGNTVQIQYQHTGIATVVPPEAPIE